VLYRLIYVETMSVKFVFRTSGPYVVELMLMQVVIYVPKSPNLLSYDT
jgi:hypothetical protein